MYKILSILFISFLLGQSAPSNEPSFIPGEQYKYDLFVDLIKVGPDLVKLGSATLSTKKIEIINGQKAYHLNFSVKTSKIGDMLFKIRDTIDVWVNTESLELIQQTKKLREGSRKSKSFTTIKGNVASTNDKEYIVPENIFDPYALIMILKNEDILESQSKNLLFWMVERFEKLRSKILV